MVVSAIAALIGIASCDSSNHDLSRAQAAAATRAGTTDAASVLGTSWEPVGSLPGADALIADHCGDLRPGLGLPSTGLVGNATSPVLFRDQNTGGGPTEHTDVRTAVVAYKGSASATAAFGKVGVAAFERCLIAAVSTYLDGDHPDSEPVPDPTGRSFTVTSPSVSAGDEAVMYVGTFDEDILGGSDNTHVVALFVARSDSLIVTAIAAANSQTETPAAATSWARRLGVSALARATAARN